MRSNDTKKGLIIEQMREVCDQITSTQMWFQMEDDQDLIEACIYQMEVLNARYRYLLRKAKAENITVTPFLQQKEA